MAPGRLFLLDSLGAMLTAIMLAAVLPVFEPTFGMPRQVLYILALIACVFFTVSFSCYLSTPQAWRFYMKIIAVANLLYCCLTAGLIVVYYQQLTVLGLAYFVLEITVIAVLAAVEWQTASVKGVKAATTNAGHNPAEK